MVASTLLGKGYEGFLPLYRCKRRWSDRVKEIELPLFSGYLFCRLDINKRLPVLVTPGVIQIVGIAKTPVPVDESEMSAIFSIVLAGVNAEPYPYLQIGQRVRVDCGILAGVEGILVGLKKPARIVVSVELLHRSVAVEIDESWVTPIDSSSVFPSHLALSHA
jgi:transcription antitermination factor NusG